MQVDWIFVLHDHMLKAKTLTNFRLSYVVLVSKFIEYFDVDVEEKLEESTRLLNQTLYLNLHKMGFIKVGNVWTVGSASDHEAGPSGANKEEEQEPTNGPMDIIPYIV